LQELKSATIDEKSTFRGEEIFQLRPNFHGIGVDLRALWRRWTWPQMRTEQRMYTTLSL
jgi:hypothetical protein